MKWEAVTNTYTVTFDVDGGSPVDAIENISHNTSITKPTDPTKGGHTFINWFKDTEKTQVFNFTTETITANITLYAKWEVVTASTTYTVSFNVDGGSPVDAIENIPQNTSIIKPTDPTKANNTFVNWFKDSGKIQVFNFSSERITANITLYAKWEAVTTNTFTVTFNLNYTPSTPITQIVNSGARATREMATRTNYNFVDWFENENLTGTPFAFTTEIRADKTLYAKWTSSPVVTFNTLGGSEIDAVIIPTGGTTVNQPTDPTRVHYTLEGWYENEQLTGSKVTFPKTISTSITLYAKWTRIVYIVTFNLNYTPSSPITQTVNSGTTATRTTPTRTNYNFVDWFENENLTGTPFAFTTEIRADKTLYAKWTSSPIVTFNTLGGSEIGAVIIPTGGTTVNKPTDPTRVHYTLEGWYENEQLTGSKVTFPKTISTSITLYAKWTRIVYIVTFDLNYENAPSGGTANSNQEGRVTKANPIRPIRAFVGWFTERTGGTEIVLSTNIFNEPTTLYAKWTRIVYAVTFYLNYENAPSGGSIRPNQENQIPLSSLPASHKFRSGYTLVGYFTEATGDTKIDLSTYVFERSISLYARWSFVISFNENYTGASTPLTETVITSGKITKADPSRGSGYSFMGWFTESRGGTQINLGTHVFDSATTLYARWQFSISFDENHNGAPMASSVQVNLTDGKVTKANPTRSDFIFNGWFTADTGGDLIDLDRNVFDTILILYAHWRAEAKANSFTVSITAVASSIQLSITSSLALSDIGAVIRLATESVPTKTEATASAGYVTLTVPANEGRKFSISQHYGSVFTDGLTLADVLSPNTAYKLYLYFPANSISVATTEITGISLTNDVGVVAFTTASLPSEGDAIWASQWTARKFVSSLDALYYMEAQTGVAVVYFKDGELFQSVFTANMITDNEVERLPVGTYRSSGVVPSSNFYFNYGTITGYSSGYSYLIGVDKILKLNRITRTEITDGRETPFFDVVVTRY